jgi:hypothetical protein
MHCVLTFYTTCNYPDTTAKRYCYFNKYEYFSTNISRIKSGLKGLVNYLNNGSFDLKGIF